MLHRRKVGLTGYLGKSQSEQRNWEQRTEDTGVITKLPLLLCRKPHTAGHGRVGSQQLLQGPAIPAELPHGLRAQGQTLLHLRTTETQP